MSHKKTPVKLETDAGKKRTPSENHMPQKKNKRRCNVFCFKMEAIVHQNLRLEKSVKKVEKSSFLQKIDLPFGSLNLNSICGCENCSTTIFFSSFD